MPPPACTSEKIDTIWPWSLRLQLGLQLELRLGSIWLRLRLVCGWSRSSGPLMTLRSMLTDSSAPCSGWDIKDPAQLVDCLKGAQEEIYCEREAFNQERYPGDHGLPPKCHGREFDYKP